MAQNVENYAIWQRKYFKKLFYTRLLWYQMKRIVPLSSESTLLTATDIMSYALE